MLAAAQSGYIDMHTDQNTGNLAVYYMHVMISDSIQSEKSQLTPLQQAFAL